MTGKVLIVDPVVTTRIVLKVKLAAAYFQVAHASTMQEALIEIEQSAPDVVLCEYNLPDGGAVAIQKKLCKAKIPVIALLPEETAADRPKALAEGLGDVISRPYDERSLLARVRNILRARTTHEELRLRTDTSAALGFADPQCAFTGKQRVGIIAITQDQGHAWHKALKARLAMEAEVLSPGDFVKFQADRAPFDALVVAVGGANAQHRLDFVSAIRAQPETRHTAILAVSPAETGHLAISALDTGAGDVMASGFEPEEAALRIGRLLRRRTEEEMLRRSVTAGLEAAVTDSLTGLYNRRYAIPYLDRMARAAHSARRCFAIMLLDLDYFKRINDAHGHATGDAVLAEFAERLRRNLRSVDLLARVGGEEFLVAMPDTDLDRAAKAAARLCKLTRAEPFAKGQVKGGVPMSVSVGLALGGDGETPDGLPLLTSVAALLEQADHALYDAKAAGRDKVRVCQSAA
ncbi:MAG: diguanylate cyclase [Pseudomonadota bacterium]